MICLRCNHYTHPDREMAAHQGSDSCRCSCHPWNRHVLSQCENLDDHGRRCGNKGKYRDGAQRYLCDDCAEGYDVREQPQ